MVTKVICQNSSKHVRNVDVLLRRRILQLCYLPYYSSKCDVSNDLSLPVWSMSLQSHPFHSFSLIPRRRRWPLLQCFRAASPYPGPWWDGRRHEDSLAKRNISKVEHTRVRKSLTFCFRLLSRVIRLEQQNIIWHLIAQVVPTAVLVV